MFKRVIRTQLEMFVHDLTFLSQKRVLSDDSFRVLLVSVASLCEVDVVCIES